MRALEAPAMPGPTDKRGGEYPVRILRISLSRAAACLPSVVFSTSASGACPAFGSSVHPGRKGSVLLGRKSSVLLGRKGSVETETGRTWLDGSDPLMRVILPAIQNAQVKGAYKRPAKGPHPWRRS